MSSRQLLNMPQAQSLGLKKRKTTPEDGTPVTNPFYGSGYIRFWEFPLQDLGKEQKPHSDMHIYLTGEVVSKVPKKITLLPPVHMTFSFVRTKDSSVKQTMVAMGISIWEQAEKGNAKPITRFILRRKDCNFLDKSQYEFGKTSRLPERKILNMFDTLPASNVKWEPADEGLEKILKGTTNHRPAPKGAFWGSIKESRPTNIAVGVLRSTSLEVILGQFGIPFRFIDPNEETFKSTRKCFGNLIRQNPQFKWHIPRQVVTQPVQKLEAIALEPAGELLQEPENGSNAANESSQELEGMPDAVNESLQESLQEPETMREAFDSLQEPETRAQVTDESEGTLEEMHD